MMGISLSTDTVDSLSSESALKRFMCEKGGFMCGEGGEGLCVGREVERVCV